MARRYQTTVSARVSQLVRVPRICEFCSHAYAYVAEVAASADVTVEGRPGGHDAVRGAGRAHGRAVNRLRRMVDREFNSPALQASHGSLCPRCGQFSSLCSARFFPEGESQSLLKRFKRREAVLGGATAILGLLMMSLGMWCMTVYKQSQRGEEGFGAALFIFGLLFAGAAAFYLMWFAPRMRRYFAALTGGQVHSLVVAAYHANHEAVGNWAIYKHLEEMSRMRATILPLGRVFPQSLASGQAVVYPQGETTLVDIACWMLEPQKRYRVVVNGNDTLADLIAADDGSSAVASGERPRAAPITSLAICSDDGKTILKW